jgi:hypothetical protein
LHLIGRHEDAIVRVEIRPICESGDNPQKHERGTSSSKSLPVRATM